MIDFKEEAVPHINYRVFEGIKYNPDNVKSIKKEEGIVKLVLVTGVTLSNVFNYLPAGIINKTETGIGATYLELISNRNSIIVEPIKITASSKANHHKAFYIGSETRIHTTLVTDEMIRDYLKDNAGKDKKIVVVADSLPRLIQQMNKVDTTLYMQYFLMIDEVDSFQGDSTFRSSMEKCVDIYKTFPKHQRALVSATIIPFSDPDLNNEQKIELSYDQPSTRNLFLIETDNKEGTLIHQISKFLQSSTKQKLMVAYNSVKGCNNIAEHLVKNNLLERDEVKILCGGSSKQFVPDYYAELDSDQLPARINLVTSAYFSGFDLKERYHLISICSGKSKPLALSEHKLKQIAGRCRAKEGLFSETIIYERSSRDISKERSTVAELIQAAENEIQALKCIELNFSGNAVLKHNLKKIRDMVIENTTKEGIQLVRYNINDEAVVAYLNIDAYMEEARVFDSFYGVKNMLLEHLKHAGHDINAIKSISNIDVKNVTSKQIEINRMVNEVLDKLSVTETIGDLLKLSNRADLSSMQKEMINIYGENFNYIDKTELLKLLRDCTLNHPDSRMLKNAAMAMRFLTLDDGLPLKLMIDTHIPTGKRFSSDELLVIWNKILPNSVNLKKINDPRIAVKLTKANYKTVRSNIKGQSFYKIGSANPLGLTLIKKRSSEDSIMNMINQLYF